MLSGQVRRALLAGAYSFLDLGCGSGGSITHCQRRFGLGPGLGLDWYGADLDAARSRGLSVAWCDVASEELPPRCVDFVSMMDFLEHLPDEAAAARVLRRSFSAARRFLFIRHPSFEDRDYLAGHGLKLSWTDWSGHPNMLRLEDFHRLFASLGWSDYVIVPHMRMLDSSHVAMVPAGAPTDTVEYDEALHGPKPRVEFDRPIHGKYDIFVRLDSNMAEEQWREVATVEGWEAAWESALSRPAPAGPPGSP